MNIYLVTKYANGSAKIDAYYGSVQDTTDFKTWQHSTYTTTFATTTYDF
ncbi:hypothetical protein [Lacticaseibacillus porcinae]|nr:hypothetical protein [Lacticaseibacillus porcinae]